MGVNPPRSTFVRGSHHFNTDALQIGMDVPGRQIQRLTASEGDAVEQQREQDARIIRVIHREHADGGELGIASGQGCIRVGGRDDFLDGREDFGGSTQQPPDGCGESRAQQYNQRLQGLGNAIVPEAVQRLQRVFNGAESTQSLERLAEGVDHFGLMLDVLVVSVCRVKRYAGSVFAGEPGHGLLPRRVGLEGQGGVGGQDFQEEAQPCLPAVSAKRRDRVCGDPVIEGRGAIGKVRVKYLCGRSRMVSQP
nr:hypothetical protein [Arthrobacter sp. SO3]